MSRRFFSTKSRPMHLGPYPCERLARTDDFASEGIPPMVPLTFGSPDPTSIIHAMAEHQAMLDAIRDGLINAVRSDIPSDLTERSNHLKSFGYFNDAAMVGICPLGQGALLGQSITNPGISRLSEALRTRQTKTLASGIDMIMADLRESMEAPPRTLAGHTHSIVFLYENPRAPRADEPGTDWIKDAMPHRAALLASETAVVVANYLRLLGFDARAHTQSCSDVDLNHLAVAAGLAVVEGGVLSHPFIGTRFGLAAVTTDMEMATDRPLTQEQTAQNDLAWRLGYGSEKSARTGVPYGNRNFKDGVHPFETLKRVARPTTYIDAPNVPRVPKRTDMFARAQFGDMGQKMQDGAKGGHYVRKAAPSAAQRRALGAFVLLQDGVSASQKVALAPENASDLIKATCYFMGVDAVGISACPDWAWYSHDAIGKPIDPPHDNAISMLIDQGYDTMEGSSGDDWIAVAQSMRAYLRFSLLGGVLAAQIRRLGYKAKAHTVMDGEVLQPPLLLLSGLGEVSRIGEVILNPFLGPRLKSGAVTTDMPLAHDAPIDFGLQSFCEACNKCARECPSGAITAGPKRMFNGYEIWKSDSQKCATYRITTPGGAMCGRCMKTCPWNLEGLFRDKAFRSVAMKVPKAAPVLAKLDDILGRGDLNPVKKWWWDLEITEAGNYAPATNPINTRGLQKDLDVKASDQTLAVYPAPLAPHPHPYPFPMDREAGIAAYGKMLSAQEHKVRTQAGETEHLHRYKAAADSPVIEAVVAHVEAMGQGVTKYEFQAADGSDLPPWEAGAHIDLVVAPEFLRPYSLTGDPLDRRKYQIGVLREDKGRGGSKLLHRIFTTGRRVFLSRPINHFPLDLHKSHTILMGGGIGITPLIAMAHTLHREGRSFEMHYSGRARDTMGFLEDLADAPWASHVQLHISSETGRVNLESIVRYQKDTQIYTCGSGTYMSAVTDAAARAGFPEDNVHLEYFSVPDAPAYTNHDFTLRLRTSGKDVHVSADQTATEALADAGVRVDVKCSDGICGVCKCAVLSGDVEHRDFVLSNAQRAGSMILCQSRAREAGGVVEIDL